MRHMAAGHRLEAYRQGRKTCIGVYWKYQLGDIPHTRPFRIKAPTHGLELLDHIPRVPCMHAPFGLGIVAGKLAVDRKNI